MNTYFDYSLFLHGAVPANAMHGYYNLDLVALSCLVAFLGSYVALDLTGRIFAEPSGHYSLYWLFSCAIVMGCSIWSMHFIGMLAYTMPIPMSYDPLWTFLSLVVAVAGSLLAFLFIKSESATSLLKMILCGTFIGICISTMHYAGMEAMEGEHLPNILYIPWLFSLSVCIAILVSIIAIWLLLNSNKGSISRQLQMKIASALVMAAAICSMHYTGMAAAVFIPDPDQYSAGSTIYASEMAYYIAIILAIMFFISLISSTQRQLVINYMRKNQAQSIQAKLEKKVEERTVKLKEKNAELLDALAKLKKIQDNLVYSEKMATVGQLSAGIAHEINNPLSYTLSNISFFNKYFIILARLIELYNLLLDELRENSLYHKSELYEKISSFTMENNIPQIMSDYAGMISESREGLLRIKSIVAGLSSLTGTITEKTSIDVNATILVSIDIIWNELKYKCNVIKHLSNLPALNGSLRQFEFMMVNLLLNASQAITTNGDITISTSVEDENIVISVTDTGCGISPENIPKLFTPFFTTKPIESATGLGLASVYRIVKSFGGQIKVKSELGKGSIFTVYLPING